MPASAQKRKLVTKLNQANGKGTPEVSTSGSVRTVGRRQRKSGDGLINLLTPRRKRPATGSYTFRQPETKLEQQHSFRRQTSLQTPQISGKLLFHRDISILRRKILFLENNLSFLKVIYACVYNLF